jgi:alkyl sulfatase BDS1-like metallo-beta-lactamase superfamily hydrolase
MTGDVVTAFFEDLSNRGHDPLLRGVSGTVRFDLLSGKTTERWLLEIRKGNLSVSHRNVAADTVMRLSRTLFEAVARGETNLLPALLRGEVTLEGDYRLMIMVRRLLRRRLAVRQSRTAAGYARRPR